MTTQNDKIAAAQRDIEAAERALADARRRLDEAQRPPDPLIFENSEFRTEPNRRAFEPMLRVYPKRQREGNRLTLTNHEACDLRRILDAFIGDRQEKEVRP